MDSLESLKRRRTTLKASATKFKNFVDSYEDSQLNRLQLMARLDKLNELWKDFHDIQTKIDELLPEAVFAERDNFESAFFNVQAIARSKLPENNANSQEVQRNSISNLSHDGNLGNSENMYQHNQSLVRLPVISLPTFNGSYEQWQHFYDIFKALVDDNNSLNAIQKFHYLTSALSGSAAQIIHSLQVSNENYPIALELLTKRFQNTRLTIQHQVHELFNLNSISKESAGSLRILLDSVEKHLRVLKQLKEPTDYWDTLIIYLITSKLDPETKSKWELKVIEEKASTTNQLLEFLSTRCEFLEALHSNLTKQISSNTASQKRFQSNLHTKQRNSMLSHVVTGGVDECLFCKQTHKIYACQFFKDLPIEERRNEAKRLNLCYNCLGRNHTVESCKSRTCKYCSKKHHSLLHVPVQHLSETNKPSNIATNVGHKVQSNISNYEKSTPSVTINTLSSSQATETLLSTAMVCISDNTGKLHKVRALLDNGSQSNFITKSCCQRLDLKIERTQHTVSGVNVAESHIVALTKTSIASLTSNYERNVNLFVIDQITRSIPTKPIIIKHLELPPDIELADPSFHVPQDIDLLLGATVFWDVLENDRIRLGNKQLLLQQAQFGWLLCGQILTSYSKSRSSGSTVCNLVRNDELLDQIENFWRIEDTPNTIKLRSREEMECERIFIEQHQRRNDGRFEVCLPFRQDPSILGESRANALKRLEGMERRFRRSLELKTQYTKFMEEYIRLGHMSPLLNNGDKKIIYLPHHAVFKESSTTTKLRVVFDASSATTSGKSLNDCLMVGPIIQPELFNILVRFRQHAYVLTGDIVKMYRQVMIKPEHRLLQCILWRTDPNELPTTYSLNTVTYGTSSALFLAVRSLQQLAHDIRDKQSKVAEVLTQDFYVDDLITGESSIAALLQLKNDVTRTLETAGFELTKFRSNLSCDKEHSQNLEFTDTKVLGFLWESSSDVLRYKVTSHTSMKFNTKRSILSVITQLFDPLGLIGPIIIRAKGILQKLWQLKLEWGDPLPNDLQAAWTSYYEELSAINDITIPRHASTPRSSDAELHGFSDASQLAYGACIYLRSRDEMGRISVRLLTAKSRVAPLKNVTVPRLELCGAVLLSNLFHKVRQSLTCTITKQYFWTDSEITLTWIRGEPSEWQTFVGNRVSEIQQLTKSEEWSHVRSEHNPADIISRGIRPRDLITASIWWEGPTWLKDDYVDWPKPRDNALIEIPERRRQTVTLVHLDSTNDIMLRYSSLTRLKRIVAYCLRFKENCKLAKPNRIIGSLTCEELHEAMRRLLMAHQQEQFHDELQSLRQEKDINSRSKILSLNPVLHGDGLLRVGGRLQNAPLAFSQKHPILLSPRHILTDLIVRDCHQANFHVGLQLLSTMLRETYWIVHARNAIKRILGKCVLCFRLRPRGLTQLMSDLPASRVTPSRPFNHTGVDYAGPFNIKVSRNKSSKAYLCLFVCMSTKAVHLEVVSDLTTDMFLNALKRFVSRRGKCESISSDNGKNFLGASNVLRQLGEFLANSKHQNEIIDFASNKGICWKFIPPHSPHMGGLWEANVKATKTHLKVVMRNTLLSFEELTTVIIQIEAILNSRPLCKLNSDPDDLDILTPGHFLIGTSLYALPDKNVIDVPLNRLNRYQLLTQLQQSFWTRWSKDYVMQMQHRRKWQRVCKNDEIQIGKVVMIRDDNLPPLAWCIGRICATHPSKDGLIRIVSIRTVNGIIQRSLAKICVLPID